LTEIDLTSLAGWLKSCYAVTDAAKNLTATDFKDSQQLASLRGEQVPVIAVSAWAGLEQRNASQSGVPRVTDDFMAALDREQAAALGCDAVYSWAPTLLGRFTAPAQAGLTPATLGCVVKRELLVNPLFAKSWSCTEVHSWSAAQLEAIIGELPAATQTHLRSCHVGPTPQPVPTPQPAPTPHGSGPSGSPSNTIYIALIAVGGAVLIAAIAGAVFVFSKRYSRQGYAPLE
jgi:hypothetical protein